MRTPTILVLLVAISTFMSSYAYADTNHESILRTPDAMGVPATFPDLTGNNADDSMTHALSPSDDMGLTNAIWPFTSSDEALATMQPKSTRKAFFLSLLLPGLGEMYVGSKRAFLFLGVEVFAWYTYLSNNKEGSDIEDDYQAFADKYWHYTDTVNSNGDPLYYNYWGFVQRNYDLPEGTTSEDYDVITQVIEDGGESHSLPSTKTQQYYEMIGKYDHFVYGWEDIIDLNPKLLTNGIPNDNYSEYTGTVKSNLRLEYMDKRGDSNDKLKAAQRGLYIMMINRVLSAIDAGRLAYKHNKKLDSDLSMIRVRMAQKRINNELVPMVIVSRSF